MSYRVEQVLVAGAILCCLMASMAWAAEEEEQQEVAGQLAARWSGTPSHKVICGYLREVH